LTKVVLNSSVLIALSATGHLDKLGNVFEEPLVARAVYEEICVNYPPLQRWVVDPSSFYSDVKQSRFFGTLFNFFFSL
jgi:hypothetical protein